MVNRLAVPVELIVQERGKPDAQVGKGVGPQGGLEIVFDCRFPHFDGFPCPGSRVGLTKFGKVDEIRLLRDVGGMFIFLVSLRENLIGGIRCPAAAFFSGRLYPFPYVLYMLWYGLGLVRFI